MSNVYLEKIAANKAKQYLQSKGHDFGPTPKSRAEYESLKAQGQIVTNKAIGVAHGIDAPTGKVRMPGKTQTVNRVKGMPLFGQKTVQGPSINRVTGDAFAAGPGLDKRLAGFKKEKALAAAAQPKGILARALSVAKKHPMAAAGVAIGAGVIAGKAMRGSNQNTAQPSYAQYGY